MPRIAAFGVLRHENRIPCGASGAAKLRRTLHLESLMGAGGSGGGAAHLLYSCQPRAMRMLKRTSRSPGSAMRMPGRASWRSRICKEDAGMGELEVKMGEAEAKMSKP